MEFGYLEMIKKGKKISLKKKKTKKEDFLLQIGRAHV